MELENTKTSTADSEIYEQKSGISPISVLLRKSNNFSKEIN